MTRNDLDAMIAVAYAHAAAEGIGDIDATMATLDDDPAYELQPIGRTRRGRDLARAYYEHFFANCVPRIIDVWCAGLVVGIGQSGLVRATRSLRETPRRPPLGVRVES